MRILLQNIPSVHKEDDISVGIKSIDREKANVEVEKDELVIKPDLSAIHKAGGKKHGKGGTPVFLEPDSFIYSDDPLLALTKKDHELFELKQGGSFAGSKNTPAEVLKRNIDIKHYNKMSATLNNNKKDNIAKTTAMLMIGKYLEKAGQVAFIQEEKKNFPNGVPDFANGTAPVYDDDVKDEITETKQYMRYGGKILPKAGRGDNPIPWYWDKKKLFKYMGREAPNGSLNFGAVNDFVYRPQENSDSVWNLQEAINQVPGINLFPLSKEPHHNPIYKAPTGFNRSLFPPTTTLIQPPDTPAPKRYTLIQPPDTPGPVTPKANTASSASKSSVDSSINPWKGFTEDPLNRWKNYTPDQAPTQCPPGFYKGPNGQCISFVDAANAKKNQPTPQSFTDTSVTGEQEQPFGFDTNINWVDKANIANQLFNTLNVNRYMPMRSQIRTSTPDATLMDPQGAINQAKQAYSTAVAGNQVMNPYLAGVQNNLMFGRTLDSINQIQGQYDQQNAQLLNQSRAMRAQAAAQDAAMNVGADQQYYKESIVGAQNFDNMRSFNRNRLFETTTDAYTNAMQANAMNMQLGPNAPYYFDYGKMKVTPNPNRDILSAAGDKQGDFIEALYKSVASDPTLTADAKYKHLTRLAGLKAFPKQKMGGKFRGKKK